MKITAIHLSTGHNYFGHHGQTPGEHPSVSVDAVACVSGRGLRGDRFFNYRADYSGQVTFFSEEVHAALLREMKPGPCPSSVYRRNLITRGADLPALIGREFTVQGVRFLGMAEAKPCHWMDQAVGPGAEAWLGGRGGLRAKILSDGELRVECPPAAGLLLAGGHSRRMGRDKAALTWSGESFGERQAATLAGSGAWPLHLACRREQSWTPRGFGRIEDQAAEGGVVAALTEALRRIGKPVVTALAVDLPLMRADWLERLAGQARDEQRSVVPHLAGRFEPLAAAWHESAQPALEAACREGRSLQDVCARLAAAGRLAAVVPSEEERAQYLNVNRPADLPPDG